MIAEQRTSDQRRLQSCKSRARRLEDDLSERTNQLSDSITAIATLKSTINRLNRNVSSLTTRLNQCDSSLIDTISERSTLAHNYEQLTYEYEQAISVVQDLRGRINSAISTANSGAIFLPSIPSEGYGFSSLFGDPYEELREKYNDLVDRFNAAIRRCNAYADLLYKSLSELD